MNGSRSARSILVLLVAILVGVGGLSPSASGGFLRRFFQKLFGSHAAAPMTPVQPETPSTTIRGDSLAANRTPTAPSQPASRPSARPIGSAGILQVDVLDVGQGDAILIRSDGKTVLVDAGTSSQVVSRLHEQGVGALDLVVVTHHHTDHYGGMDDVIREFQPKYFLATASGHTTSMYLRLLKDVEQYGVTVLEPGPNARQINLGSTTLTVFPQPPENTKEENDNSIGLRLTHGQCAMLMTGDSEEDERDWWMENCPELLRDCDVLKLAHHGSRNGTDSAWLDLVRPSIAVASLGEGNSYGHPHPEVIELLREYQIPLYRTDLLGTIRLECDGRQWEVVQGQLASASGSGRIVRTTSENARGPSRDNSVDLNSASRSELEALPGIGPALSRRIIGGRPYQSIEELEEIPGISGRTISQIRPYAHVE